MATRQTRTLARFMAAPSIILLFVWMIVPLVLTLWFSLQRYNLNYPDRSGFVWFRNYYFFLTDPAFVQAIANTLILVGGVLVI
ncbi:MAG: sugar ABC transporter permease, partial [Devosia sp.]